MDTQPTTETVTADDLKPGDYIHTLHGWLTVVTASRDGDMVDVTTNPPVPVEWWMPACTKIVRQVQP